MTSKLMKDFRKKLKNMGNKELSQIFKNINFSGQFLDTLGDYFANPKARRLIIDTLNGTGKGTQQVKTQFINFVKKVGDVKGLHLGELVDLVLSDPNKYSEALEFIVPKNVIFKLIKNDPENFLQLAIKESPWISNYPIEDLVTNKARLNEWLTGISFNLSQFLNEEIDEFIDNGNSFDEPLNYNDEIIDKKKSEYLEQQKLIEKLEEIWYEVIEENDYTKTLINQT